jgi:putative transposase
MIMEHRRHLGTRRLCEALGEPRASLYRSFKPPAAPHSSVSGRQSHRRLSDAEEQAILDTVNSDRFRDMAPAEIVAVLLDESIYYCSERTMYRILEKHGQNIQRRQSAPRTLSRPELLATRPKELWSWDITKLKGPAKWTYFYLYKIMDVFSRFVVGWMVAFKESANLAQDLIAETCLKQEIVPGTLTIHADNGSSMKSVSVGQLLMDLGVTKTHSRPHVSNDNPYSESAFKTLKYRPDFPDRFGSIQDARSFCRNFFEWYNMEHRHSGIAMMTPCSVHYGTAETLQQQRSVVLIQAYMDHPERFVKGVPSIKAVPQEVWINKPNVNEKVPDCVT